MQPEVALTPGVAQRAAPPPCLLFFCTWPFATAQYSTPAAASCMSSGQPLALGTPHARRSQLLAALLQHAAMPLQWSLYLTSVLSSTPPLRQPLWELCHIGLLSCTVLGYSIQTQLFLHSHTTPYRCNQPAAHIGLEGASTPASLPCKLQKSTALPAPEKHPSLCWASVLLLPCDKLALVHQATLHLVRHQLPASWHSGK